MASSNIARLGVVLGLDTALFTAAVQEAINTSTKLKSAIARESKAAEKEIQSLKYAIEDYGKEVSKVTILERELENGRFKSIKGTDLARQLLEQAKAYDQMAVSQKKVQTGLTDQQRLALTYQTTDLVTQLASGQNAMIALLQQGGQLKDQMGGIGPMFKAIGQALTPTVIGFTALAAALGSVATAMYMGANESQKLRDILIVSGDLANIAGKNFQSLANILATKTNVSLNDAKNILMVLAASGQFTETSIDAVSQAIAVMTKLSGKSAEEMSQQLIPAFNGTAASAKSLNDKYNFLTLATYKQIEALEREGKLQEAAKLTAESLTKAKEGQTRELGYLERAWKSIHDTAIEAWDAMMGLGRKEAPEARLNALGEQLKLIEEDMRVQSKNPIAMGILLAQKMEKQSEQAYLQEYVRMRAAAATKAAEERKKIDDWAAAGGIAKQKQLQNDAAKQEIINNIERKKKEATEIGKIELDAEAEIAVAKLELARKNEQERGVFATLNAENYRELVDKIMLESDKKISDVRKKRYADELKAWEELRDETAKDRAAADTAYENQIKAINDKITLENISLQNDQKKLELQQQGLFMSEKEQKLMMLDLELAQQIAEIKRTLPDNADRDNVIKRLTDQNELKKGLVNVTDAFQKMKEMSDSVWNNMSNALENFVRTGKLSFKELARSIIQDLILIQLKAQMLSIFRFIGGALFGTPGAGGVDYSLPTTGVKFGGPKAAGGSVSSSQAYLVGEQGPELFMPRSAGTIVPNSQLGMGTTNVTNNYINAIDVKSFEQRLLSSSNAVWAANAYAQKSLAVGRGRS